MSFRCDRCGKKRLIGRNVSHKRGVAGGQWKKKAPKTRKVSLPNLQPYKGVLNGGEGLPACLPTGKANRRGKWRLCTRCLRTIKKQLREKEEKKKAKTVKVTKVKKETAKKTPKVKKIVEKARIKKKEVRKTRS